MNKLNIILFAYYNITAYPCIGETDDTTIGKEALCSFKNK